MAFMRHVINICAIAVTLVFAFATAASFCGEYSQTCELLSHFRCFLCLLSVGLPALLAVLRFRWLLVFASVIVLVNAYPVLELYLPTAQARRDDQNALRVLQMNLWGSKNHNYQEVLDEIEKSNADVVGLSEITKTWAKQLDKKMSKYPYRIVEPAHGGVALYSRFPLVQKEVRFYEPAKRPRIFARMKFRNQTVTVLFVHPVIPIGLFKLRNEDLQVIGREAASAGEPVLVFGDLNCTPWSFFYRKLKKDGKLSDTMRGFGVQATWNAFWYFPTIPIDHCFASKEFITIYRPTGSRVGSDHLPVYVELLLRKGTQQ